MSTLNASVTSKSEQKKTNNKQKTLHIEKPCSLAGNSISMKTGSQKIGVSQSSDKELTYIEGLDQEVEWIDNYIAKNGSTSDSRKKVDSYLTSKLVKDSVRALIEKHSKVEEGGKKFSLSNKVLTGFAKWNKALTSNTKFEPDTTNQLKDIDEAALKEFSKDNRDLIEELGEKFTNTDLYIKSELLSAIIWFVENPIDEVIVHGEAGTDAIMKVYKNYISFVKKISPKQAVKNMTKPDEKLIPRVILKQENKNIASMNIEYNLAYITLAWLISSYDEYNVKNLTQKAKKFAVDYGQEHVKDIGDDRKKLRKLINSVGTDTDEALKVTIRLLTHFDDRKALEELAPRDKKLEAKLANENAKWSEFDINALARDYTNWMLRDNDEYNSILHEIEVSERFRKLSKHFVICGNAADISRTEGIVDSLVLTLKEKFEEYSTQFKEAFNMEPKGKYTTTYCGRKVLTSKKTKAKTISPLTDSCLLFGLKAMEEVPEDDEEKEESTKTPPVPCYGSYMCKLYKEAIKSFKFTFVTSDPDFTNLINHITRDAVNMYTGLGIESYNKFAREEIYKLDYYQLSVMSHVSDTSKADTMAKKLALFAAGQAKASDLPDTVPMVVDVASVFNEDIAPCQVYKPDVPYNFNCPLSSLDLTHYRSKVESYFNHEHDSYVDSIVEDEETPEVEEADDSDEDNEEEDEEVKEKPVVKKPKKRAEPTMEKIFKTYYKSSATKTGNKNTTRFLSDLSMLISYIVSLRLVWLSKLITFASTADSPYHTIEERKSYVGRTINQQINVIGSSVAANESYRIIHSLMKELRNKSSISVGDNEKALKDLMRTLRSLYPTEFKEPKQEGTRQRNKKNSTNIKEVQFASGKEKKLCSSTSFIVGWILEKVFTKKLDSVSQNIFQLKVNSLVDYSEQLAGEHFESLNILLDTDSNMTWSYPIKPFVNADSINLITTTLQRTLLLVVEGCLTSQFYNEHAKKNVVEGPTISALLNIHHANEIW